jgi:hypothetical protein
LTEDQSADPTWQNRIAGAFQKQSISGRTSVVIAEPNPRYQFFPECDIVHLRTNARDEIGEDCFALLPLDEQQHSHAVAVPRGFQEPKVVKRD